MTTFRDVENLVIPVGGDDKPLGHLTWGTIRNLYIPPPDLHQILMQTIGDIYMPKPNNFQDSFRRACERMENKSIDLDQNKRLNLLIRSVKNSGNTLIRHLVREVVDEQDRKLDYRPIAALKMENGQASFYLLGGLFEADLHLPEKEILQKLQTLFQQELHNYGARVIRGIVGQVLTDVRAVSVRLSGGVYFVQNDFEHEVEALKKLHRLLEPYHTNGKTSRLFSVPVINNEEQVEMVELSLEEQVQADTVRMLKEGNTILEVIADGKKIQKRRLDGFIEQFQDMQTLVKSYQERLHIQAGACDESVKLVANMVRRILTNMEPADGQQELAA